MKKNSILLLIFLILSAQVFSQKKSSTVSLQNEFIRVEVNTEDFDTGRFSIDTVKGDPTRDADDNKILIYGHPKPWTSFTTIRIDGENYVFGGKTKKRAGISGKFGEVIKLPYIESNTIITKCKFGNIIATQSLSIIQGPASKLSDTVKILYTLENNSGTSSNVGIRMVLDTMLGTNDGAPFRVGERNILSEEKLEGEQIPASWVVFDNLENPTVIAKGTLMGDDFLPPSKVIFSNWGKVADNLWDIPYVTGQSFQREGEEELDTAISLYFEEKDLPPGGSITYTTLYGLEYLNIIGDILRIGVPLSLGEISTARGQIKPFTLVAYLLNRGGFELKDVKVSIVLPDGLTLYSEIESEKLIGNMPHNQEVNVAWQIIPQFASEGEKYIKVQGAAVDLEKVENKTKLELIPPPCLLTQIVAPRELKVEKQREYFPNPFKVDLIVKNKGRVPIDNITVNLVLPDGLKFPEIIKPDLSISRLPAGEDFTFSWKIIATGEAVGEANYKLTISSDTTDKEIITNKIFIPQLSPAVEFSSLSSPGVGSFFPVEIILANFNYFKKGQLIVNFDPVYLHCVYVSSGEIFTEKGSISKEPLINNKEGEIIFPEQIKGSPIKGSGIFATLNFKAKNKGKTKLEFSDVTLLNTKDEKIDSKIVPGEIEIVE